MKTMLTGMLFKARWKVERFIRKEDGDVNIISIVVLIGIALVLALLFKERIQGLINTLFDSIDENAKNAIAN